VGGPLGKKNADSGNELKRGKNMEKEIEKRP